MPFETRGATTVPAETIGAAKRTVGHLAPGIVAMEREF
jgi:hypothetical protein